ncbi:DUF7660 family protein [Parachitinimonas caeni]|uniref:DUF7660 domain-containing protein n=1 Tax=Parachitinimonas caeni TaxID=3031301 RepID=A0ABT7DZZ2_9NEIS|nr:hypothetical protein [Parachitinimonas caeni]MDK2125632.1 hypothetical protein [Parachitinimonas caeni]
MIATKNKINSRDGLISLLKQMALDLRENPDEWENRNLEDFLEAMASWIEDMDGYYENLGISKEVGLEDFKWRILADVLLAARVYE